MEERKEETFDFTWIIENFSMTPYSPFGYLESSTFTLNSLPTIKWKIDLARNKCDHFNGIDVTFSLHSSDSDLKNCEIYSTCEMLSSNERLIATLDGTLINKSWGHLGSFKSNSLLRSLTNDTLILKFTFKFLTEINEELAVCPLPYEYGLFSNVVLHAGGASFNVHKAILWARWPRLAEKLDEENTTELFLDIPSNVLETIIKYIYTGKMDFNENEPSAELLAAAVKYELPHLICTPVVAQNCRTRVNVEKVSFEWRIQNFSSLPVRTELQSQLFRVAISYPYGWYLIFHLKEVAPSGRTFEVFLCPAPAGEHQVILVRSRISLDEANFSNDENLFLGQKKLKCANFSRVISTNSDDTLLLKCVLKFSNYSKIDTKIEESSYSFASSVNCKYFSSDLENLYESRNLSDVNIVVGSEIFPTHKFVLCSGSSVFCRMFETEMVDSKTNSVEISGVDPWIIDRMLHFLYSGRVGFVLEFEENATKLYIAADKYDIGALKKLCASTLKSMLCVQNVCEILQLANRHSDNDLYNSVFEFISGHAEEVFASKQWKEIFCSNSMCAKLLKKAVIENNAAKQLKRKQTNTQIQQKKKKYKHGSSYLT